MKNSIFDYQDYKTFLNDIMGLKPRGHRSRLAEALRCHTAYITLVLSGNAHLSLEQAELANQFLGHSEEESHFFILLVQLGRAGTTSLQNYFQNQLKAVSNKRLELKNRLQFKKTLSAEDQSIYYSSWHYAAVHILLSIPALRTKDALAHYLRLPSKKIAEVLDFLVKAGLVETKDDQSYVIGTTHIHLPHDSPMISKHHSNWRMRAIESFDSEALTDLHYSSVVTMSKKDGAKIRAILIKAIEDVRSVVKDSPEEEGFCYTLDLFPLRRD